MGTEEDGLCLDFSSSPLQLHSALTCCLSDSITLSHYELGSLSGGKTGAIGLLELELCMGDGTL